MTENTNAREIIVSQLRGFFACPILTKLGEYGILKRMIDGPFDEASFEIIKSRKRFKYILDYLNALDLIKKENNEYTTTKLGDKIFKRWGSFALLYSYRELVQNIDSLLVDPDFTYPQCDRRYNVIGSGETNGRKFFPEGINMLDGVEISSVTDLCCGDGEFLKCINKKHPKAKLNAADLSNIAIEQAKTKLGTINTEKEFIQTDAKNIENWANKLEASEKSVDLISMWYLIHEISENSVETVVEFLKGIRQRLPKAHLLIGEIVRIDIDTLKVSNSYSIIPEFLLFHDFSGQGVLKYEELQEIMGKIPYDIVAAKEFDYVENADNEKIPSAIIYYLEPN